MKIKKKASIFLVSQVVLVIIIIPGSVLLSSLFSITADNSFDSFSYDLDCVLSKEEHDSSYNVYDYNELRVHANFLDQMNCYWFFLSISMEEMESDYFYPSDCYYLFFDVLNDLILDTNDIAFRISHNESLTAIGGYNGVWWFTGDNLDFLQYRIIQTNKTTNLELFLLDTSATQRLFQYEPRIAFGYYFSKHDTIIMPHPIDVDNPETYISMFDGLMV